MSFTCVVFGCRFGEGIKCLRCGAPIFPTGENVESMATRIRDAMRMRVFQHARMFAGPLLEQDDQDFEYAMEMKANNLLFTWAERKGQGIRPKLFCQIEVDLVMRKVYKKYYCENKGEYDLFAKQLASIINGKVI